MKNCVEQHMLNLRSRWNTFHPHQRLALLQQEHLQIRPRQLLHSYNFKEQHKEPVMFVRAPVLLSQIGDFMPVGQEGSAVLFGRFAVVSVSRGCQCQQPLQQRRKKGAR
jgi:hypothetical protein